MDFTSWPIITQEDKYMVLGALDSQAIKNQTYQKIFAKAYLDYLGVSGPPAPDEVGVKPKDWNILTLSRCTHAIHVALAAYGIGPGDEVIVQAFGFAGTTHPILWLGAKPVFVDVEYETGNINPQRIPLAVTAQTKAILLVHMHGYPSVVREVRQYIPRKSIPIIEDACQAHGAIIDNNIVGSSGNVTCFSINPVKNLPSTGGGFIVTSNRQYYERCKKLAYYGELFEQQDKTYRTSEVGFAYSMSAPDAALALSQLRRLNENNYQAQSNAYILSSILLELQDDILLPPPYPDEEHPRLNVMPVWHKYRIRFRLQQNIWELLAFLRKRGLPAHRWTVESLPESCIYPDVDPLKYPNAWRLAHNSFCVLTEHTPLAAQDPEVIREYGEALKDALKAFLVR